MSPLAEVHNTTTHTWGNTALKVSVVVFKNFNIASCIILQAPTAQTVCISTITVINSSVNCCSFLVHGQGFWEGKGMKTDKWGVVLRKPSAKSPNLTALGQS